MGSLGLLALVGLALAPIVDQLSRRPAESGVLAGSPPPTPTRSPGLWMLPSWRTRAGGAPFVVCGASDAWRRPTIAEQTARLASDPRYRGTRFDDDSPPAQTFRAPAVLYDGAGESSAQGLIAFTGLWSDRAIHQNRCRSAEPQVWLFGYEPVDYAADDREVALLRVRPAAGYRFVVLTGMLRHTLVVAAGTKLAVLDTSPWLIPTPSAPPSVDRIVARPPVWLARAITPVALSALPAAGSLVVRFDGTWRYDGRAGTIVRLALAPVLTEHPAPQGSQVAVERLRPTPGGYLIAKELAVREQGVERVVYRTPGDGFYWSGWSPDGRYLALWEIGTFSGSIDQDGRPLVVIDARSGDRTDLGKTLLYGTTAWTAPHTLAYVAGSFRMVWATKALRLWAPETGIRDLSGPGVAAFAPVWSADGRSLYFVSGPDGQWDPVQAAAGRGIGNRRANVWDAASGSIRALAHEPGYVEEGVRPSRDGAHLLVLRRRTAVATDLRSIPEVDLEVWLTDADGANGKPLVRFPASGLNAYGYHTGPSEWDWSE